MTRIQVVAWTKYKYFSVLLVGQIFLSKKITRHRMKSFSFMVRHSLCSHRRGYKAQLNVSPVFNLDLWFSADRAKLCATFGQPRNVRGNFYAPNLNQNTAWFWFSLLLSPWPGIRIRQRVNSRCVAGCKCVLAYGFTIFKYLHFTKVLFACYLLA